jgi:hypothetical protein
MTKLYKEIQSEIEGHFDHYINNLFTVSKEARKYYYWSVDFFSSVGGLSFRHYNIDTKQKGQINALGNDYFESSDIQFSVNRNSHRNDLTIKNITRLFSEQEKAGQSSRYEYVKEFILWQLLLKLKDEINISLLKEQKKTQLITDKNNKEQKEQLQLLTLIEHQRQTVLLLIEQQKQNFLVTYISYLCNVHPKPIHPVFKEHYISYSLTSQGEELNKKLTDLDKNYNYKNTTLLGKIENLYVLKKEEAKIHFVFSLEGGGAKEELRELLEVMGKEETGKHYRGQANSTWNLDASITRVHEYATNEADMYYDVLSLKPDAFQNDTTIYERLITMQHFGMPTRLLDITRNPLVAIFFACNNYECKENDGVIFTFKAPEGTDFLNFENDRLTSGLKVLFNHKEDLSECKEFLSEINFIKGIAKNQRINNQSGDFIFVGKGKKIKETLHQLPKMAIVIDSETKKVLLEQLESLNIHGGAVYPDLTHMSNYISNKYLNDKKLVPNTELNSNVVRDEKDEVIKPVTIKKPVLGKAVKNQAAGNPFDFGAIKNKSRGVQLSTFANFHHVEPEGLNKIVIDFLFSEKRPFRDEVFKIMNDKPPLKGRAAVSDSLTDKIITLAKIIDTE